jgi:hypothetical protein
MHHATRRPQLDPACPGARRGSPDTGRAWSPQRPQPPCPNPFLIVSVGLETSVTPTKQKTPMHSNRHCNGRFQHAFRAGSICGLRVSIFDSHFSSFQIDTSGDLKSHLNHCKQRASVISKSTVSRLYRLSICLSSPSPFGRRRPSLRRTRPPAHPICVRCYICYMHAKNAATLPQVRSDD